ncbi:hypothetical protein FKW77_008279 [Venturia effusa]|uniref:Uncharacterized protein n=1 Tax=Venturia effusa TaxID=50376 RepID=A0A517KZV9_9PEZI|nr:hypothetical protein FKW77_008279 [Venturia effusa]
MATNTSPNVKILVGNSSKIAILKSPIAISRVSPFSKAARRLIGAAAGSQQSPLQIQFASSEYWSPDVTGVEYVLGWLASTQWLNGVLLLRSITKEVVQANQMPLAGLKLEHCLRIHEALLILEPENILAYQYMAVRGTITNVVSTRFLSPAEFAMLVHIFRAPQSLDTALVDLAISKAGQQIASNRMPFDVACRAYTTIIQSQRPCPDLYAFRFSILGHIDTKLTVDGLLTALDCLGQSDRPLAIHALRRLVLKEVKGSAESIELDTKIATNPKLVTTSVAQAPRGPDQPDALPASFPKLPQLGLLGIRQPNTPFTVPTQHATRPTPPRPNRLPNLHPRNSYQPSKLGPNAQQRKTGQTKGLTPNFSSPSRVKHGSVVPSTDVTHQAIRAALQALPFPTPTAVPGTNTISSSVQPAPRNATGNKDDEPEAELLERTRIAASRSMMRLENGRWVEGKPGLWNVPK